MLFWNMNIRTYVIIYESFLHFLALPTGDLCEFKVFYRELRIINRSVLILSGFRMGELTYLQV